MDSYTAQRLGESKAQIEGVLAHCDGLEYGTAFDVGSGAGLDTFELASRFASVVAIDNRSDFIRKGQRIARDRGADNITFLAHDALQPLPTPERFDFVYCNNMSHHVASRCALISQLADSLKPGGWLFISEEGEGCPAMLIEEALESRDDVALREFSRQVVNGLRQRPAFRVYLQGTLEPMLAQSGFDVTRVEYVRWGRLPHLQRTWARAVAPVRVATDDPDYLSGQRLEWAITPLLALSDRLYGELAPEASFVEKVRRRAPRRLRQAQPDWELAERSFATFKESLDGAEVTQADEESPSRSG